MIAAASLAALGTAGALLVASPVQVTVTAPSRSPKINAHWAYTLKATSAGKPVSGKITVQIVDPLGGVHAVEFGASTKVIKNIPFKGTFKDYMVFPTSGKGVPLTIRFTLRIGTTTKVVNYAVTPGG